MACRRFGRTWRPKKTPEVGEMERWQRLSCEPSACATIPSISTRGPSETQSKAPTCVSTVSLLQTHLQVAQK
jgi:hypothetical protein